MAAPHSSRMLMPGTGWRLPGEVGRCAADIEGKGHGLSSPKLDSMWCRISGSAGEGFGFLARLLCDHLRDSQRGTMDRRSRSPSRRRPSLSIPVMLPSSSPLLGVRESKTAGQLVRLQTGCEGHVTPQVVGPMAPTKISVKAYSAQPTLSRGLGSLSGGSKSSI